MVRRFETLTPADVLGLLQVATRRPDAGPRRNPATLTPMPTGRIIFDRIEPPACDRAIFDLQDRLRAEEDDDVSW